MHILTIILWLLLGSPMLAATDQLLVKRNSRPLMAEGSIEALSSWETPLEGFFVRTHHNTLPVKVDDSWTISFDGLLRKNQKMTVKSLRSRPQTSFYAVLECSGNGRSLFNPAVSGIQWQRGAIGNAQWTGVALKDVFSTLGLKPEAKFATFEGYDEPVIPSKAKFVRSIPVALLIETGAILAFEMNREPLPIAHGGPVRLVLPNIYGQNWIKWVNKVTFTAEPDHRTYAAKAYRMPTKTVKPGDAWDPVKDGRPIDYIKVQTIFTAPKPGESVSPGKYVLRGKAFSGAGAITKVEVSLDSGASWKEATITERKDHSWQEFEIAADISEGKAYQAIARATDIKGNVQPLAQEWNPKGYLYNAADRVPFRGNASEARLAEGAELVRHLCLTCHSWELIEQQNLSKNDWVSVVKKMADYGLALDQESVVKIADALSEKSAYSQLFANDSHYVDFSANPETLISPGRFVGRPRIGKSLFSKHCAPCHGEDGNGKNAPGLKGRNINGATFFTTVKHGRRLMPAFTDKLNTGDIEDIRSWLQ